MAPRNEFDQYDGYLAPPEAEDLFQLDKKRIDKEVREMSDDELLLNKLLYEQEAMWSPTRDLQIKNLRSKIAEDAKRAGEPVEG